MINEKNKQQKDHAIDGHVELHFCSTTKIECKKKFYLSRIMVVTRTKKGLLTIKRWKVWNKKDENNK